MNTTEASSVNVLLRWLLERDTAGGVTNAQARLAADHLATRAQLTLDAGVGPIDVAKGWPEPAEPRCAEHAVEDDPDADLPAWARCALPAWHRGDHQVRPPAGSDFAGGLLTWERTP